MDLDSLDQIKGLDHSNMLGSIEAMTKQCEEAWHDVEAIQVNTANYAGVNKIVIAGMGGSSYAARIIDNLYYDSLQMPIELANDYHLPAYVDENTLVFLSSYSGGTEETLSCGLEAQKAGAKIIGATSGGKLGEFLKSNNYPAYIFDPKNNPSGQPRLGQGYMVLGELKLLEKTGLVKLDATLEEITSKLEENNKEFGSSVSKETNTAKKIAQSTHDKIPVIVTGNKLEGAAYSFKNPLNENAKNFAVYFVIPEMNHHLLEGLKYPEKNKETLNFVFINSPLYESKIQKRFEITKDVVGQHNINREEINLTGKTQLVQSLELIHIGNYISFYLAMLNNLDPSPIPWVDYFKDQLSKS